MNIKNILILSAIFAGTVITPSIVSAEIQCPTNWVKKIENSVVVCVAQDQNQAQAQVQNNNQTQTVNQNVTATGGSSSSTSSSSSNTNVTINNPTPSPSTVPQVIYTVPTQLVQLPKTGLPETAMALSALLPAGFALKKYGFKKSSSASEDSANSIWLEKQSH